MFDLYGVLPKKDDPRFWVFEIQKTPHGTFVLYGMETNKTKDRFGAPEFEGEFKNIQDTERMLEFLIETRAQKKVNEMVFIIETKGKKGKNEDLVVSTEDWIVSRTFTISEAL